MNDNQTLHVPFAAVTLKPLVSIGMPVYNGAKFIREALDSLLTQTFTNFELIIADNASMDNTEAICREYVIKDERIRYVRHEQNLGPSVNFKYVLYEAVGEYFMWAAYDDVRSPNFLNVLLEKLIVDKEYSSAFGLFNEIDENGTLLNKNIILDFSAKTSRHQICKYWLDFRPLRDVWIYGLHRRSAINKIRITPWAWINNDNPLNSAHPILTFMLTQGKYYFYPSEVIFHRRILKTGSLWTRDLKSSNFILNELKYLFLKFNLIERSVNEAIRGSESKITGVTSFFCIAANVIREICIYHLRKLISIFYTIK